MNESEMLEFKRTVTKGFCREIVAFANTKGGRILVGVEDDGTVVGVEDPDAAMLNISNIMADSICPEIRAFVSMRAIEMDGKPIVEVTVEEGDRKPYCVAQKGFVPAGVLIRTGTANTHASPDLIRDMIRESDGDSYECRRAVDQQLAFAAAQREFAAGGIAFGEENKRSLGFTNRDGYFTNLALLFSDQSPFSVKCAVFNDGLGIDLQSRKEFGGSLFDQLNKTLEFLDIVNRLRSRFEGAKRIDMRDYPPKAIREALLNCLVHRSYDFDSSVIVNVFPDRIEFVSIGGLVRGVTREDILAGVSATRNPRLAATLYRLSLVEGYGMGIRSIRGLYAECARQPEFRTLPNSFVTVLPNMHEAGAAEALPEEAAALSPASRDLKQAILDLVRKKGEITRADAEIELGATRDAVLGALSDLIAQRLVVKHGRARGTVYRPA